MATIGNQFSPKFFCEQCQFETNDKKDFNKHKLTRKHLTQPIFTEDDNFLTPEEKRDHSCERCDKKYDSKSGLWRHMKKCNENNEKDNDEKETDKDKVINLLIKENADFKNIILEIIKHNSDAQKQNSDLQQQLVNACKISNSTINSHNNNKTFNLQIFLNEQCKDAMNMSEFVDSFDLTLTDLESVGDLGYVEGMTKIFVDKLNSMDVCKRPMHCSDAKREILYIKDENKWEREKPTNPKLRKAVKNVSFKNMKLAQLWSDTYPDSKSSESRLNDVYMRLVLQSTGGSGDINVSEDKIIRRIAKEIVIDKNALL
jgi:hypothetical protein